MREASPPARRARVTSRRSGIVPTSHYPWHGRLARADDLAGGRDVYLDDGQHGRDARATVKLLRLFGWLGGRRLLLAARLGRVLLLDRDLLHDVAGLDGVHDVLAFQDSA